MTIICLFSIAEPTSFVPLSLLAVLLLTLCATDLLAQHVRVVTPEKVGLSSERLARLDHVMQEEIDQKRKAGVVVLVARHGSIVHFKALGMADIESGVKMRTDHLFRLYSMTKPVTSTALLMLYEEGKFQLTDRLEQYIPAFKNVKVFAGLDGRGEMILDDPKLKITVQDVFRHTAGFSYFPPETGGTPVDKAYRQAGIGPRIDSLKGLVDKLAQLPLLYQPGEQWVYSFSHDVQAYLVEYFSGMRFDAYVRTKITEPLGMKDTVFGIPKGYISRYTTMYGPAEEGGLKPIDNPEDSDYAHFSEHPSGGRGLSCPAMDYFLFSQMLLNQGRLGNVRILGRKTVELMTSNNLPPLVQDIGETYQRAGYGLGVSVLLDLTKSGTLGSQGQFGWGGTATTRAIIDPKEDLVALLFMQYMPNDRDIRNRFQTLVYQAIDD